MDSDQEEAMLRLLMEEVSEHGSLLFAHPADVTALIDGAETADKDFRYYRFLFKNF